MIKSHVLPSLILNECSLAKRLIKVTDIGIPRVKATGKSSAIKHPGPLVKHLGDPDFLFFKYFN